ncbi:CrfX protein [Pseudomonas fluvialis]|uniref:CrfX protein n=1 Tax=Pseudomonas fluvialis TaxID=1793966 RepID=UPI0035B372E1
MRDPFEESLRDLLKSSSAVHDDNATLGRVLKTANRQVGAGDLFSLLGHALHALMLGLNSASSHAMPVSRRPRNRTRTTQKAE